MFFVRKPKIASSLLWSFLIMTIICSHLSLNCNATTLLSASARSNRNEFKRTPKFFKENCACSKQWQCECCAKVNNDLLNVHQTLCADWLILSQSWNIRANVRLNNNILYTNTFSAWNIPSFCVPIWPAIALTGCVQMHSFAQHENNKLHGCANVTINFITFNLVNFQMGCMDIGTEGIQFVEANHHDVGTSSTEKPPEIELETNDLIKITTFSKDQQNDDEDDVIRPATIRQDSLTYLMSKNF